MTSKQGELPSLTTETQNQHTLEMDLLSTEEQFELMNQEDKKVALAVEKEKDAIVQVIDELVARYKKKGRIIYVGAGTSGRLGVLDAVETLPTFGVDSDRFVPLLAGGITNFGQAGEDAEDDPSLGVQAVEQLDIQENDTVIGIAASGRTPYVIGALDFSRKKGALTVAIACNKNSEIGAHANLKIEVDCGPEVLTGSTRLKSGTAQKMILNMISTITMIRVGKTFTNLMVDVQTSNEKLVYRWKKLVQKATNCSFERAEMLYKLSNRSAKIAIVMELADCDFEEAQNRIKKAEGFVRKAI